MSINEDDNPISNKYMLENAYFLQEMTGQYRKNGWSSKHREVKRKEEEGRSRVGSHDCVHAGTEMSSLFKLGKHNERELIRWLVCRRKTQVSLSPALTTSRLSATAAATSHAY